MRYRVSAGAQRDLEEIFAYWAKRVSAQVADHLIDKIIERFWLLSQYPSLGRSCEAIAPGVRCFAAGKYLIYYRHTSRRTDILHIFHGARDQKLAFDKGTSPPR